jgi:hypothetical protein
MAARHALVAFVVGAQVHSGKPCPSCVPASRTCEFFAVCVRRASACSGVFY